MKVELYASLAANGLMLTADPSHPTPPAIFADFLQHAKKAGALILGRATYEMAASFGVGDALAGVTIVVVSSGSASLSGAERAGSPSAALELLEKRGHARALLGGGAVLYNAFLESRLVDELRINVMPTLTSRGKPLTAADEPQALRLLSTTQLIDNVTQLFFSCSRPAA